MEDKTSQIRLAEARASAAVIGAVHHPPIANDLMIFYDDRLLRRMAAVVRGRSSADNRPAALPERLHGGPHEYRPADGHRLLLPGDGPLQHERSAPRGDGPGTSIFGYHAQPH